MQLVMNHGAMRGESYEDETAARVGDDAGTGGSSETSEEQLAMEGSRGTGGAIRDRPPHVKVIPCPRCQSMNTKFCYYNNYSVTQPRHFCRNCQRYWTVGGTLRNVPVGGGSRKKTRPRSRSDPYNIPSAAFDSLTTATPQSTSPLLIAQQLSMLPPSLASFAPNAARAGPFPSSTTSHLPGLLESLVPRKPLLGLQEVPDLQSFYDQGHITTPPLLMNNFQSFLQPQPLPSQNESLISSMAKASGLWASNPMQTPSSVPSPVPSSAQSSLPSLVPSSWEDRQTSKPLQQLGGGYGQRNVNLIQAMSLVENSKPGAFWDTPATQTRLMMDDRLVPHASWEESSNPSTVHSTPNLSPNGSSTTDHSMPHGPSSYSHNYCDDVSQPWVGLHAADILNF